jgi:hypothetical protein
MEDLVFGEQALAQIFFKFEEEERTLRMIIREMQTKEKREQSLSYRSRTAREVDGMVGGSKAKDGSRGLLKIGGLMQSLDQNISKYSQMIDECLETRRQGEPNMYVFLQCAKDFVARLGTRLMPFNTANSK